MDRGRECVRAAEGSGGSDRVRADIESLYGDRLKSGALGCVKRAPAARGRYHVGFTQPRNHFLADPCRADAAAGPRSVGLERGI